MAELVAYEARSASEKECMDCTTAIFLDRENGRGE